MHVANPSWDSPAWEGLVASGDLRTAPLNLRSYGREDLGVGAKGSWISEGDILLQKK